MHNGRAWEYIVLGFMTCAFDVADVYRDCPLLCTQRASAAAGGEGVPSCMFFKLLMTDSR